MLYRLTFVLVYAQKIYREHFQKAGMIPENTFGFMLILNSLAKTCADNPMPITPGTVKIAIFPGNLQNERLGLFCDIIAQIYRYRVRR